jgi:hypothetical protein
VRIVMKKLIFATLLMTALSLGVVAGIATTIPVFAQSTAVPSPYASFEAYCSAHSGQGLVYESKENWPDHGGHDTRGETPRNHGCTPNSVEGEPPLSQENTGQNEQRRPPNQGFETPTEENTEPRGAPDFSIVGDWPPNNK